jgi:peptide deformylase
MKVGLSGFAAKVFQHECSHINGWNMYDEDFVPEACKTLRTEVDKTLKDK